MGRFKTSVPNLVLLIVVLGCAACGGGASSSVQSVTPPAPDFSLTVSSDSVSVSQGATSTAIVVGVTPQNGFSGSVQMTIGGLPSGVTSSPASPFSIAAGASTPVIIGAAANAQPGSYSISAQGTS